MQSPQFGCFTVHKPECTFVSENDSDGLPIRKRKVHAKSRYGCRNCKERKVKCDEQQPCGHCVKRNENCRVLSAGKLTVNNLSANSPKNATYSTTRKEPKAQPHTGSPSDQRISPINLQHLQLLYHFEKHTSNTFIMDPKLWRESVVCLALQNTFLMNAVFLMTASHLQYVQPYESRHSKVVLDQLSQVLPNFRAALGALPSNKLGYGDALMACSMLLLQYSWKYPSEVMQDIYAENDGWDTMLGHYEGVRNIVMEFWDMERGGSRFTTFLIYSPRISIDRHLENTESPPDIEACFEHCLSCTKISTDQGKSLDCCTEVSRRLIPIWRALRLCNGGLGAPNLLLDVARYLFTLPSTLPSGFVELTHGKDGRYQLILLYYFAAISRLPSERFWWMRGRAIHMFETILLRLKDKCEECTRMASELFNGEDNS